MHVTKVLLHGEKKGLSRGIIDQTNNYLVLTIPYNKTKKQGRRMYV